MDISLIASKVGELSPTLVNISSAYVQHSTKECTYYRTTPFYYLFSGVPTCLRDENIFICGNTASKVSTIQDILTDKSNSFAAIWFPFEVRPSYISAVGKKYLPLYYAESSEILVISSNEKYVKFITYYTKLAGNKKIVSQILPVNHLCLFEL